LRLRSGWAPRVLRVLRVLRVVRLVELRVVPAEQMVQPDFPALVPGPARERHRPRRSPG